MHAHYSHTVFVALAGALCEHVERKRNNRAPTRELPSSFQGVKQSLAGLCSARELQRAAEVGSWRVRGLEALDLMRQRKEHQTDGASAADGNQHPKQRGRIDACDTKQADENDVISSSQTTPTLLQHNERENIANERVAAVQAPVNARKQTNCKREHSELNKRSKTTHNNTNAPVPPKCDTSAIHTLIHTKPVSPLSCSTPTTRLPFQNPTKTRKQPTTLTSEHTQCHTECSLTSRSLERSRLLGHTNMSKLTRD